MERLSSLLLFIMCSLGWKWKPTNRALGDEIICFPTNESYHSRIIDLEMPMIFYRQNFSSIDVSARTFVAFVGEKTFRGGYTYDPDLPPYLRRPFSYFNQPAAPFLSAVFAWGSTGEICYQLSQNLSFIEQHLEIYDDQVKRDIGFNKTKWSLLNLFWNNITVGISANQNEIFNAINIEISIMFDGMRTYSKFTYNYVHPSVPYLIGFNSGNGISRVNNKYFQFGDRHNGTPSIDEQEVLSAIYRIDGDCISVLNGSCPWTTYSTSCNTNTSSAIECACLDGFHNLNDNYSCSNINECLEDPCDHYCIDMPGSYVCECLTGWELQEDERSCKDIDECRTTIHHCHHNCSNSNGSFECTCKRGYHTMDNGITCTDIDECEELEKSCQSNEVCINTNGSFHCNRTCGILKTLSFNACVVSKSTISGFVSGSLLLVLLGVLTGVTIILCGVARRLNKRKRLIYDVDTPGTPKYFSNQFFRHNLLHCDSLLQLTKVPRELKIRFEDLECDAKMIGEGEFGSVYKAKLRGEVVAVKILKGFSGTSEIQGIIDEVLKMKDFSHPNILTLKAVALDRNESPCIVMPFMWNGSLDVYLRKEENRRALLLSSNERSDSHLAETAAVKLLGMCLQIAKGMAYLSSKKIIHRDLAARNCMMDMKYVIKVADFGLAVEASEDKNYFKPGDEMREKLPVKWLAIESLLDHKFSEFSDVWSYGVTCWEIFNGGRKPYPDIKTKELLQQLLGGYRMEKPQNQACTDSIYNIMVSCWKRDPLDRLSFAELVVTTSELLQDMKEYLPLLTLQQQDSMMEMCQEQKGEVPLKSVPEEEEETDLCKK